MEVPAGAGAVLGALSRRQMSVLVVSVFVAGLCSIVYELLIGTISSYFLGDSVTQFSITIGLFMAAMGLGSFLSRNLGEGVLGQFVAVEIGLGIAGGLSAPALYYAYAFTELYYPVMILFIVTIGVLTGLEVPMLVLAMQRHFSLEKNLSNILSLDYLGALAATLLFPFVLLPSLGTFRSALSVGAINLVTALLVLRVFWDGIPERRARLYQGAIAAGVAIMIAGFVLSPQLLSPWHGAVYEDRVVFQEQSRYQNIILTRGRDDLRMFLDGNLQFSSIDEYRYHEALVHVPISLAARPEQVLVLGGGDGLAVRELLKHHGVRRIVLVDLDPSVTRIAREHPMVRNLNEDSLADPRVRVVNQDAFVFLEEDERLWDVIIADLPDPNNPSLARLYSREFYGRIGRRLARGGVFVTQATSPFFSLDAFWCIEETLRASGLSTAPYHAYVPSFGDWGFVLAAHHELDPSRVTMTVPTRFLDDRSARGLFTFERDLRRGPTGPSTLDQPLVLGYYLAGWQHWN